MDHRTKLVHWQCHALVTPWALTPDPAPRHQRRFVLDERMQSSIATHVWKGWDAYVSYSPVMKPRWRIWCWWFWKAVGQGVCSATEHVNIHRSCKSLASSTRHRRVRQQRLNLVLSSSKSICRLSKFFHQQIALVDSVFFCLFFVFHVLYGCLLDMLFYRQGSDDE